MENKIDTYQKKLSGMSNVLTHKNINKKFFNNFLQETPKDQQGIFQSMEHKTQWYVLINLFNYLTRISAIFPQSHYEIITSLILSSSELLKDEDSLEIFNTNITDSISEENFFASDTLFCLVSAVYINSNLQNLIKNNQKLIGLLKNTAERYIIKPQIFLSLVNNSFFYEDIWSNRSLFKLTADPKENQNNLLLLGQTDIEHLTQKHWLTQCISLDTLLALNKSYPYFAFRFFAHSYNFYVKTYPERFDEINQILKESCLAWIFNNFYIDNPFIESEYLLTIIQIFFENVSKFSLEKLISHIDPNIQLDQPINFRQFMQLIYEKNSHLKAQLIKVLSNLKSSSLLILKSNELLEILITPIDLFSLILKDMKDKKQYLDLMALVSHSERTEEEIIQIIQHTMGLFIQTQNPLQLENFDINEHIFTKQLRKKLNKIHINFLKGLWYQLNLQDGLAIPYYFNCYLLTSYKNFSPAKAVTDEATTDKAKADEAKAIKATTDEAQFELASMLFRGITAIKLNINQGIIFFILKVKNIPDLRYRAKQAYLFLEENSCKNAIALRQQIISILNGNDKISQFSDITLTDSAELDYLQFLYQVKTHIAYIFKDKNEDILKIIETEKVEIENRISILQNKISASSSSSSIKPNPF